MLLGVFFGPPGVAGSVVMEHEDLLRSDMSVAGLWGIIWGTLVFVLAMFFLNGTLGLIAATVPVPVGIAFWLGSRARPAVHATTR